MMSSLARFCRFFRLSVCAMNWMRSALSRNLSPRFAAAAAAVISNEVCSSSAAVLRACAAFSLRASSAAVAPRYLSSKIATTTFVITILATKVKLIKNGAATICPSSYSSGRAIEDAHPSNVITCHMVNIALRKLPNSSSAYALKNSTPMIDQMPIIIPRIINAFATPGAAAPTPSMITFKDSIRRNSRNTRKARNRRRIVIPGMVALDMLMNEIVTIAKSNTFQPEAQK
mmetsp:Transcript_21104/g.53463  ORF Transcript_21104/g.53463 Transcript_21104/m.53463 type:complete len:230 (+) Transcript_21104:336-1025(+)